MWQLGKRHDQVHKARHVIEAFKVIIHQTYVWLWICLFHVLYEAILSYLLLFYIHYYRFSAFIVSLLDTSFHHHSFFLPCSILKKHLLEDLDRSANPTLPPSSRVRATSSRTVNRWWVLMMLWCGPRCTLSPLSAPAVVSIRSEPQEGFCSFHARLFEDGRGVALWKGIDTKEGFHLELTLKCHAFMLS